MRSTHTHALLALAFLALGCGQVASTPDAGEVVTESDGGTDGGATDAGTKPAPADAGEVDAGFGPIPIERWCEHLALARCHQKARCLSLSPAQVTACLARENLGCDQAALTQGVTQGRLQYLPNEAPNCINAYAEGSCTARPEACEAVFQGLVAADGGCVLVEDCQSGSYCLTAQNTCPHTCYPYRGVGDPCNSWDQQCDPQTAYCNFETQRCAARRNAGESCTYWGDCHAQQGCVDGVCVRLTAGVGETCRISSGLPACDPDTFCRQEGAADMPGECALRVGLGGACTGYGTCRTGLRCSSSYATGTCIPLGAAYDSCSFSEECQAELYCSPTSSQCLPLPQDGGNCGTTGSSYRCAPGYYCDFTDVTCRPLKDTGEACGYDGVCRSNTCDFGTIADGGTGYACTESCSARLDGGT